MANELQGQDAPSVVQARLNVETLQTGDKRRSTLHPDKVTIAELRPTVDDGHPATLVELWNVTANEIRLGMAAPTDVFLHREAYDHWGRPYWEAEEELERSTAVLVGRAVCTLIALYWEGNARHLDLLRSCSPEQIAKAEQATTGSAAAQAVEHSARLGFQGRKDG